MRSVLLDLTSPKIMGILNLTPDSFSDGGKHNALDAALARVDQMIMEGADIIDLGGESTRPGAQAVSEQQELDRVIPVLEKIRSNSDIYLSVDTSNKTLMREAVAKGANLINDVRALQKEGAVECLVGVDVDICLMHMAGSPQVMQNKPEYNDVVEEVLGFLGERVEHCVGMGIDRSRIVVDPGFGFGKTLQHNLKLLNQLQRIQELSCPVLVGVSRKSMIGAVLGAEVDREVGQRLSGSLAAAVVAVQNGAKIIRVHDVKESKDAIKMAWAIICED